MVEGDDVGDEFGGDVVGVDGGDDTAFRDCAACVLQSFLPAFVNYNASTTHNTHTNPLNTNSTHHNISY